MRRKFVCANWKSNAPKWMSCPKAKEDIDVAIAAPFTELAYLKTLTEKSGIKMAAQNVSSFGEGAYTGEVTSSMLKNAGCSYCLVGHSERREYFKETSEELVRKIEKATEAGITSILCVGENLQVREAGSALSFVENQLKEVIPNLSSASCKTLVIAYEPIWAIGSGKSATNEDIKEMCSGLRNCLRGMNEALNPDDVRILYGGSVKPETAEEIMKIENVDGVLVGGASLKADSFETIMNS